MARQRLVAGQGELVTNLVDRLTGRYIVMLEVQTGEMPPRSILCLNHNVDEAGAWTFGKEMGIMREARLPRIEGRTSAVFVIYWGEVSAESDGPVEWCRPVPDADAETLAAGPSASLCIESARREAYVHLGRGDQIDGAQWPLADEALRACTRNSMPGNCH